MEEESLDNSTQERDTIIPSAPPQEIEEIEEEIEENSILGTFKKYLVSKLTSPTTSSTSTPIPEQEPEMNDLHRILWTQFQVIEWNEMITKLFLIYCFANGVDIYDISNPKQQFKLNTHSFLPVFSLRTLFTIKIAKLISPFRSQFSLFPLHDTIVAMVCPDANKIASTLIRFYSLCNKDYLPQTISMNHHEIYSLEINSQRGMIIVGTRDQIFVYNSQLEKVVQFSCAMNSHQSHGYGCMALSDRWLAYPSSNPIPNETYDYASQSQSFKDVSVNVAKKAASGLLYLGDVSRRVVQNVLVGGTTTTNTIPTTTTTTTTNTTTTTIEETNTMDGIVEMRDMVTRQILVQFRAHYEPISMIQFDSSGTLLATASIEGTYVNIFLVMPLKNSSKMTSKSILHLYKLYRGVTSASIQNIQFSVNSKWVAVSSAHGTTHLFAIPKSNNNNTSGSNSNYPIVCHAMQRIHNFSTLLHGEENIKAIFHAPIAASFYASKKLSEKLLISTSNGQLLYYNMEPTMEDVKIDLLGKFDTNQEEEEKSFDVSGILQAEEMIQWSVTRESEDDRLARWISHVETETYTKPSNPLWMTGQFKFKSFAKDSKEEEVEEDSHHKSKLNGIIETTPIPSEDLMKSLVIKSTDPIPIGKQVKQQPVVMEEFASSLFDNQDISRAMESKIGSVGSDHQVDEFFKEESIPHIKEKDYKSAIQEKHFFTSHPTHIVSSPILSSTSTTTTPIVTKTTTTTTATTIITTGGGGFKVNEDYLSEKEEEQEPMIRQIKVPNLLDTSKINELIQKKEKMQFESNKSPVIISAPSFMSDDFKKSTQQWNGPIPLKENFFDSTFPIQQPSHKEEEEEEENDLISFGSDQED